MPNYGGHLIGGAVTYSIIVGGLLFFQKIHNPSFDDLLIWLIMCLLGALFPDIDIRSKGQKLYYRFLLILTLLVILAKKTDVLVLVTFAALFPSFVAHRGIMHRVSFIITIPLLAVVALFHFHTRHIPSAFGAYLFFVAGAFSHLLLDFGPYKLLVRSLPLNHHKKRR